MAFESKNLFWWYFFDIIFEISIIGKKSVKIILVIDDKDEF